MPYKLFNDGDILTHLDVNAYFMDQALVVFDTYDEMVAAYGGVGEAPNQVGRIAFAIDTNKIYIYNDTDGLGTMGWSEQLANIADGVVSTSKLKSTSGSEAVTTATIRSGAVTSDKIADGTIVNGDINASAAIALSKLATGSLPTGITVASANLVDLTIDTADIADDAITSDKLGTDLTLTGTTKIEEIFESATIVASQPVASNGATLTLTITNGAVYYYTTATSHNIVLDLVTTGLAVGQAATILLMVTSGATTGKLSSITVNGSANTPKWFGGNSFPNGSAGNAVDAYTVTVFRSSTAYTVFASQSKFA